jgi:hypothetical protein
MRASISSSCSSDSLKPRPENSFTPLSWKGLCDAEITTPASTRMLSVRNAIPGVGSTPISRASPPMEVMPLSRALSSM